MHEVHVRVECGDRGYVAHAIGLRGTVVSDGASFEEVLSNIRSAIVFHIETFGAEAFDPPLPPPLVDVGNTKVILDD